MNAFGYLIWTSWRNRFLGTLKRVRSPRYAIAAAVGVLYVWSFLFRPMGRVSPGATSFFFGHPTEMLITLLVVVTLMGSWIFGGDSTALAFSQAEVSILFSAPLSRRQLIMYKLSRSQIAVLINALVWVFILKRGGTAIPSPLRVIALWVLFSTLSFHRLGAALVRSAWTEHGGVGAKRHIASIVVFAAIGVMLLIGLFNGRHELAAAHTAGAFFTALGVVLSAAPAYWGLYPFHLVVAPTFAQSSAEWTRAIVPAIVITILHAWWVLHTDAAFEDAAIAASAARAQRVEAARGRRSVGTAAPRATKSTIALAAGGHPAVAILWKNMLCLRRTSQLRVFIAPLIMSIAIGWGVSSDALLGTAGTFAVGALVLAAALLLFGGRLLRNDLRHDMQHLPLIKSLPVSPHHIVLAEVASSALPLASVQTGLVLAAYAALSADPAAPFTPGIRLALAVASPFAVVALNGALSTIQNATAVLFPAWVRLGPQVSTGVEALGQNLLATVATLIALVLSLIVPIFVSAIAVFWLHETRAVAVALIVIISAGILAAETYAAMGYLGRALSRAEPLQTA
ncbi:MAG: putative ABC exporter domain-containing protein [Gemmatimonadaceae bacterium]